MAVYCSVCGAKLKWYHKRVEFTFANLIPTPDRKDAQQYTWKEYVCSACLKDN